MINANKIVAILTQIELLEFILETLNNVSVFNGFDRKTVYLTNKDKKDLKLELKRLNLLVDKFNQDNLRKRIITLLSRCTNKEQVLKGYLSKEDLTDRKWYKINSEMVRSFKNGLTTFNRMNQAFCTDIFGEKVLWVSVGNPTGFKDGKARYDDVALFVFSTKQFTPSEWKYILNKRFNQSLIKQHRIFRKSTVIRMGKGAGKSPVSNSELLKQLKSNNSYAPSSDKEYLKRKEDIQAILEDAKELDGLDDGTRVFKALEDIAQDIEQEQDGLILDYSKNASNFFKCLTSATNPSYAKYWIKLDKMAKEAGKTMEKTETDLIVTDKLLGYIEYQETKNGDEYIEYRGY